MTFILRIILSGILAVLPLLTGCNSLNKERTAPSQTASLSPSPSSPAAAAPSTAAPAPAASATAAPQTTVTPAPTPPPSPSPLASTKPKGAGLLDEPIDHVVIVVEENHSYKQVVGNKTAPFMQSLVKQGALFTRAYGVTHPSQPNYLALFSGSTQGVTSDSCLGPFDGDNLATELKKAKLTFTGYSEDLPRTGFTGCSTKVYARKHNPWAQFTNVPKEWNRPLTDFPKDFSKLPTVSFVIPNVKNDMHDGTVQEADDWLKNHLGDYTAWAQKHNSLLIVTWDEDDFTKVNQIPVIFVGPMIKHGTYDDKINHYHVLRTIEDLYGLRALGHSKDVLPITSIWK